MKINEGMAITFDDVLLVPRYSEIESRLDVSLETQVSKNHKIKTPLVCANMDSVSSVEMAVVFNKLGGLCPIHRFMSIEDETEAIKMLVNASVYPIAATIGINPDWKERLNSLASVRRQSKNPKEKGKRALDVVFIDVAHGHCKRMLKVLEESVKLYPDIDFIPGNVVTAQAVKDFESLGAAGIKVGVGNGAACLTRLVTGFGVPQITALRDCCSVATVPVISDGGIKHNGDIVKALAFGASTIMSGFLFAGTKEAAGNMMNVDGVKYKVYRGSASKDAQIDWKGADPKNLFEEGASSLVPFKGKVEDIIISILNGVRSGMSYCGAKNVKELQEKSIVNIVSPNTIIENSIRIRFNGI